MLRAFLLWLQDQLGKGSSADAQSWSQQLLGSPNFFFIVYGTNVIIIMLFVGTIMVVDLRLLGVTFKSTKVSVLSSKVLPLTVFGFAMMIVTGLMLFYAKPIFYYHNLWFRAKLLFIVAAMINIAIFHFRVQKNEAAWDASPSPPWGAEHGAVALKPASAPKPIALQGGR